MPPHPHIRITHHLGRLRRIAATVTSFATFGLFALVLSVLVVPLICACSGFRRQQALVAQRCIHISFRYFTVLMRVLGAIDFRIENAERLHNDTGCLIVANHPSLLDYVFLTSLMPRCDCVVKESLWNNFFMRGIIRSADYIPNRSAEEVLVACREKLHAGGRILVFPEGTRTTLGQPISLQRGAANIAVRCRADLRVVHITCTPPILSKQQRWWSNADTLPVFRISIREKIRVADFIQNTTSCGQAARLLNKHLAHALEPTKNTTSEKNSFSSHEPAPRRHKKTHHRDSES
ncbi:MAG: 1-acyl-sn-glycerol-3-phosphate acyltransferase [Puniceicoccales bacterium]|nr:1-acyl-sn-glycerol-3-phosphate acyltransferase [Puniceicoccales bacterium]